ncbi:MAG: acyltransferase [Rhodanobacteraceae bacterium]|nr:acyltransferase [Rhodanobacteraceae bacterium]
MRTIAAAAARDGDNFVGLRHVAALMVLWAHSWSYLDRATEPLARALAGFDSGRFGVYLFFAISGFLITLALCRNDALPRYAWHRALRVYPAYAACLLVSVFAIGATFTTLPLSDYLAHPRTWSYFTSNGMLISLQWDLPGVFVDQPLSGLVNGSLWSLGAEIRWYSLFGVLALFGLFRHRRLFTVVAALLIADSLRRHGWPLAHLTTSPAITQLFLLGALAALWRDVVPLSARVLVPLWLVAIGCVQTRFGASLLIVACVYLALYVAYALPVLKLPKFDYSYGLFLYGAPIQQSLITLFPDITPLPLFATAFVFTLPLAMLSWHLIEAPALRHKHHFDDLDPLRRWRRSTPRRNH